MFNSLDRFERFAQRILEGSLSRLLGVSADLRPVAQALENLLQDYEAETIVPNEFYVEVNESVAVRTNLHGEEAQSILKEYIVQLLSFYKLIPSGPVSVQIAGSPLVREEEARATARITRDDPMPTRQFSLEVRESSDIAEQQAAKPFLIVGGKRHVPIGKQVVTVGRQLDNDIVVDSPAVSRFHAQVAFRQGNWIVRDLGSRFGTFLNGQSVDEALLRDGDVIRVGDIALVFAFAEDEPGLRFGGDTIESPTMDLPRPSPE